MTKNRISSSRKRWDAAAILRHYSHCVYDAFEDSDGLWAYLKMGWEDPLSMSGTVHLFSEQDGGWNRVARDLDDARQIPA